MRSAADTYTQKSVLKLDRCIYYITAASISKDPKGDYWGQKLGIQFAKEEGMAAGKELLSNP